MSMKGKVEHEALVSTAQHSAAYMHVVRETGTTCGGQSRTAEHTS